MNLDEMLQLLNAVSDSKLTEFQYEEDNYKIRMKKEKKVVREVAQTVQATPVEAMAVATEMQAQIQPASVEAVDANAAVVESPLVGTFYAAPSPDADPYIKVGDTVKVGQTLAIVEAMKLMNEIESDVDGVVSEILVKDGEPVEYGQPLFKIL